MNEPVIVTYQDTCNHDDLIISVKIPREWLEDTEHWQDALIELFKKAVWEDHAPSR